MAEHSGETHGYEVRAKAVATMQLLDLNGILKRRYDDDDASDESCENVLAATYASQVLIGGLAEVIEWDEQEFYEYLYDVLIEYANKKNIELSQSLGLFMSGMAYGVD